MKRSLGRLCALALSFLMLCGPAQAGKPSPGEIDALLTGRTDPSQITSPVIEAVRIARESAVGINIYQDPLPRSGEAMGMGSGTVVSPWGHVLTNYHVVEQAQGITVLREGLEYGAYLVEAAPELDLAVLLAPELKLKPAALGDSDALQIGEWAIIIGNPASHDYERSAFVGVVSALGRVIQDYPLEDRYGKAAAAGQTMVQTDAAINPGASGGGMFNILGQLQGVAALKITQAGGQAPGAPQPVESLGFCVPINQALPLIRRALEAFDISAPPPAARQESTAPRPRLGLFLRALDDSFPPRSEKLIPRGLMVESVEADSPAKRAGLLPGDIIAAWNGIPVPDFTALDRARGLDDLSKPVALVIYRSQGLLDFHSGKSEDRALLQGEYLELTLAYAQD